MIISEKQKSINRAEDVAEIIREILSSESEIDRDKEHVWVLGLSTNNCIKYIELVSLGSLNFTIAQPREVFRLAIMKAVNSVMFIHNHPSGHPDPSKNDIETTNQLKEAGKIIGITLLDSIIVTAESHYSFQGNGLL